MLLTAKEGKVYQSFFSHFALRLVERYDIFITFEEYVYLSKLPYLRNPKVKKKNGKVDCKYGYLIIKDKKVKVIKSVREPKPLLTALPIK